MSNEHSEVASIWMEVQRDTAARSERAGEFERCSVTTPSPDERDAFFATLRTAGVGRCAIALGHPPMFLRRQAGRSTRQPARRAGRPSATDGVGGLESATQIRAVKGKLPQLGQFNDVPVRVGVASGESPWLRLWRVQIRGGRRNSSLMRRVEVVDGERDLCSSACG